MTFDDLPRNGPHRPLTEPQFVADVLDLVVTGRSRALGEIYILLCRRDDRLAQPCAVAIDVCVGGPRLLGVDDVTEAGSMPLTDVERAPCRAPSRAS
jgi:hypothetical protein